jgi:hypothetical protein
MEYYAQLGHLWMDQAQKQVAMVLKVRDAEYQTQAQILSGAEQLINTIWGHNKAAFRAMQLLKLAEVWINYAAAVMHIYATAPFPMWPALTALARVQAGISAALIMAQKAPNAPKGQFHAGGIVPSTGSYVLERGEIVIPHPPPANALGGNVYIDLSGAYVDSEDTARALARMVQKATARGWA